MKTHLIVALIACVYSFTDHSLGSDLFQIPDAKQTLDQKMSWVANVIKSGSVKNGYWIGYSIRRLMDSRRFLMDGNTTLFGTMSFDSEELTLEEKLSGKTKGDPIDIRKRAADLLNEKEDRAGETEHRELRDIAILLRFEGTSTKPSRIGAMSLNLPFESKGLPLFWLGYVSDAESYAYLSARYSEAKERKAKQNLIGPIALHQTPGLAFPFLRNIIKNETDEDFREKAAFWLGHQLSEEAFSLLVQTIQNDPSEDVRQNAIWGLAEMKTENSNRTIINFARSHPSEEVRKTAIYALEEINSKETLRILEEISWSDPEEEFRKTAMATLSNLPNGRGVPALIKILEKHPSRESRKVAIWMLQDTDDPRARQALANVVTQHD